MGIENRGHRQGLMVAINALPVEEMFEEVPVSIFLINFQLDGALYNLDGKPSNQRKSGCARV